MLLRRLVCAMLISTVAIVNGCSKKTVYPDSPAMSSGVTDSEGTATFDLGPFTVNIHVEGINGQPLPGMNARAYLLKNYIMAVASSPGDAYYSNLTILTYDEAQSISGPPGEMAAGKIEAPQAPATRDIDITVVMTASGLASYGYDVEPSNMEALETDEWITPVSQDYDLTAFYNLAGTVDYTGGTIVHLTPAVSYVTGAGRQSASFLMDQIADVPTFASLISLELRIFDGDTLHTRVLNFQDSPMPVLLVDDIIMNRDFWLQITLTWGENPADLDSHIWTPAIDTVVHHIYFANRGSSTGVPYVDLDVDDVTSYGPEHITVYSAYPGDYTYAVYHFSGTGDITTSGAEVGILDPDGGVQIFDVPSGSAGQNWWWWVCTINGDTGAITPINTISADPPLPEATPPMPPKMAVK